MGPWARGSTLVPFFGAGVRVWGPSAQPTRFLISPEGLLNNLEYFDLLFTFLIFNPSGLIINSSGWSEGLLFGTRNVKDDNNNECSQTNERFCRGCVFFQKKYVPEGRSKELPNMGLLGGQNLS